MFARFESGDFGLEDEERPGKPKKFKDEELEALLDEYCCQTQEELAESLGVTTEPTVDGKFYPTRLIAQTLPLLTTICSGRCRTP